MQQSRLQHGKRQHSQLAGLFQAQLPGHRTVSLVPLVDDRIHTQTLITIPRSLQVVPKLD